MKDGFRRGATRSDFDRDRIQRRNDDRQIAGVSLARLMEFVEGARRCWPARREALVLEEIGDRDVKQIGELEQGVRAHADRARLIGLDLPHGDIQGVGQGLASQPQGHPPHLNAAPDMDVNQIGSFGRAQGLSPAEERAILQPFGVK